MEYYEHGGSASAKLQWSYPGQTQAPIPQTQLYPPANRAPVVHFDKEVAGFDSRDGATPKARPVLCTVAQILRRAPAADAVIRALNDVVTALAAAAPERHRVSGATRQHSLYTARISRLRLASGQLMNSNLQGIIQGSFPLGGPANAGVVQRFRTASAVQIDPAAIGTLGVSGRPLPPALQTRMSALFGQDFTDVRVHIGQQPAKIGAVAFAMGPAIYFAPGRYQPDTADGQRLIAHELAHVVQQRSGRVPRPSGSGLFVVQHPVLESEAERMGRLASTAPIRPPLRHSGVQRKPGGVIQRWPPGVPGTFDPGLDPSLLADTPVVRLWTPPPRPALRPDSHTPIPQPVRIFDITGRGTSGLLGPTPPLPTPPTAEDRAQIRAELDQELEDIWRRDEERDVRDRYQVVHSALVDLKYVCLREVGADLTVGQMLMLDNALHLMANHPFHRGRILHTVPRVREDILATLSGCRGWIEIVEPLILVLAECRELLADVEEIAEQLSATVKIENLHNRKTLSRALQMILERLNALTPICPAFWKAALACDNHPVSLNNLKKTAAPLKGLAGKLKVLQKDFNSLGAEFEDAQERTPVLKTAPKQLSVAESVVVAAWNVAYAASRSPFMEAQIQKILAVGDFQMLRELTAIVAHIRATGGARYNGVDIYPHALVGSLKGAISYDFPFLNKTRLGHTNRGIWRILFQGARVYGIYNDHNGQIDKWKGEGLSKTAA